jgi:uncharacterized protein YjdB
VALRDSTPADDPDLKPAAFALAPESKSPASVTITQLPARPLTVGSTAALGAEVRDTDGSVLRNPALSWSSTDSAVASVDSATGSVRALAPGQAQIIAVAGSSRDSARIVVRLAAKKTPTSSQPASLSIAPHEPLRVGDTATLALTALDRRGNPVRPTRITWSSSEPRVVEVNARTGQVRAHGAGTTLLIARSGSESAISSLTVLPPSVTAVTITGARPLKVGDTLALRAEAKDSRGRVLSDRAAAWESSRPDVATVDSTGVVVAGAPGSVEITASADGKSGSVRVTVLPQPRTGRVEMVPEPAAPPVAAAPAEDGVERQRLVDQMVGGVERCYDALDRKDTIRVEEMYQAASRSDRDKLKKLTRILSTREWDAEVGPREDGPRRVESAKPTMEFAFLLTWTDAFGGHLSSRLVFQAQFTRLGGKLDLSSCRIVGSPKL